VIKRKQYSRGGSLIITSLSFQGTPTGGGGEEDYVGAGLFEKGERFSVRVCG